MNRLQTLPHKITGGPKKIFFRAAFLLITLTAMLPACSLVRTTTTPKTTPPKAAAILTRIALENKGRKTFNGLAGIRLKAPQGALRARMAWIGSKPEKLRLELMDTTGRPLATSAFDGKKQYLSLYQEKKFYRIKSRNPDLKRLVGISIKTSEVLLLLSGGIPLSAHDTCTLEEDPRTGGQVLSLKKRWGGIKEKLYLTPDNTIHKIEMFESGKALRFTANLKNFKTFDNLNFPSKIEVFSENSTFIQIVTSLFRTGMSVEEQTFVLTRPKKW